MKYAGDTKQQRKLAGSIITLKEGILHTDTGDRKAGTEHTFNAQGGDASTAVKRVGGDIKRK